MLCVDERGEPASGLDTRDGVQRHRGLAGGFRAIDLNDSTTRQTADTQGHVQRDRSGRNNLDGRAAFLAQSHDRALTELPLDLGEG